jgi:hypothetical protein
VIGLASSIVLISAVLFIYVFPAKEPKKKIA